MVDTGPRPLDFTAVCSAPYAYLPGVTPMPTTRTRPRCPPARVRALALAVLLPSASMAQNATDSYVLLHDGTEVIALTLRQHEAGRVTGSLSALGKSVPLTGTLRSGTLAFTMSRDDKQYWGEGKLSGDRLDLLIIPPGEDGRPDRAATETYLLMRRGAGWTDASPLARQWRDRLRGKMLSVTDRTAGGESGGATAQRDYYFCENGEVLLETKSVVTVTVPDAGGGQTSRSSDRARWRIITRGDRASIELSKEDGDTFQVTIRAGEAGVVYLVDTPVRMMDVGSHCQGKR